jgi:outer membrane usher protein FimD/PapC
MKSETLRHIVLGFALTAMPVYAHHAFAAEYSLEQPVTIKGTLTKLEWMNPHGWIYVEVKDDDGKVTHWAVEFGAPNTLLRQGLRKADFPVGTPVVVKGYRAKDGSATANGTTVTLPDGRSLYVGSSSGQAAEQKTSGASQ